MQTAIGNVATSGGTVTLTAGCTYTMTTNPPFSADGPDAFPDILGNVTIVGNGATITRSSANGTPAFRFFTVDDGASLNISNVTLSNGLIPSTESHGGGAIINRDHLTATGVTFQNNTSMGSAGGGAIDNHDKGVLAVDRSTFSGNKGLQGGAIEDEGTLCHTSGLCGNSTVTNTTFINNSTTMSGGGGFEGQLDLPAGAPVPPVCVGSPPFLAECQEPGGAHDTLIGDTFTSNTAAGEGGGVANFGTGTITNSTITGNTAGTQGGGGVQNTGTLTITFSTISGNTSPFGADLHAFTDATHGPGATTVTMSIVSAGSTANCSASGTLKFTDGGYNIDSGNSCGFAGTGSKVNTDPKIGPLASNGGPTQTMALQSGSPAIDAIPTNVTGCSGTDQRGVSRPQGSGCDIGAFEVYKTPPTVPTGLTANAVSGHEIDLSWSASSSPIGVDHYDIFRNGAPLKTVSGSTLSFADTGVADATTYLYTVDAGDAAGNTSAQSSPASATTPDVTPPSVPTNLVATPTKTLEVDLSWSASTDNVAVTGYDVYRNGAKIATVSGSTLTYADTAPSDATTFSYTVDAFDAAGNHSAQSAAATATTPDLTPPTAPTNLQSTTTKKPSAILTWTASTDNVGVAGYSIYRDGSKIGQVGGNTLTFEDTTINGLTTYTYYVTAFDAAGNISGPSNSVTANAGDVVPPTVPTGLTAAAAWNVQQVTLNWNASTDDISVTGYTIYRNGSLLVTVTGSTLTYVDTTVAPLTNYSYTVDAFDGAGNHSAQSSAAALTTAQISYFNWFDLASPGMLNDNIHLLNTGATAANVTVSMPSATPIHVTVPAGGETYVNFGKGHLGGPVVVNSDQAIKVSQRVQYYSTFNEEWAETAADASATSFFNWYDKASSGMFNDNIHLLNPNGMSTTATVTLGSASRTVTLGPGAETYVTFPTGTIGGPVTISSTLPVLASQRVQFGQSFNEVWSGSQAHASTISYVNWFDKASAGMMNDNIHLLNPGAMSANVTVKVGATSRTATVPAGGESYVTFPSGTIGGPVTIMSDQPILASQRVQFMSTFNEVWSESPGQAGTAKYVTWFDKASPGMYNDNIHLLNPGGTSANVTVTIGASSKTVTVAAGAESYVTFPVGTIGGPVVITSNQPILASQRVQYYSSFNEIWAA